MTRPDAIVWLPIPRWLVSAGALVCLVVLTCVPVPANARDPDFVSWKKTCNTATSSYRDRILTAYCNFSSQPSSLNTSDCRSGPLPAVVSYGGKLRCHYLSDHGVSGTYLKGCLAIRATGKSYTYLNPQTGQATPEFAPQQISASCLTANGGLQETHLYPTYAAGWGSGFFCGDIANQNGTLVCTPVPSQASKCADPSSTTVCSGGVGASASESYPAGWSPSNDTDD